MMLGMLLWLAVAQAAPQPAEVKTFGDWAVACDNGARCEMTSLIPAEEEQAETYANVAVTLVRQPGADGPLTVEIAMQTADTGLIRVSIDGKPVAKGNTRNDGLTLTGEEARRFAAAMANGALIQVSDEADTMLALASLKGSSAAMRFMDAEQGRAGSVTALVAKGSQPASAVPAAPALPRVPAKAIGPAATPPAGAELAALQKRGDCDPEFMPESFTAEAHALAGGATLILVPCSAGAYNFSSVPFVKAGGKTEIARFDVPVTGFAAEGMPMLVNAGVDGNRLSSFSKGRGLGDCGVSQVFAWDGARFRLVEERAMGECRGSVNWLPTWRAEAR